MMTEITPTPVCVDKVGQLINVGDYIAYGHALGRCAGIRIGKVLKIRALRHPERDGLQPEWRITVQGVDDDWEHRPPELCARVGTLQFPKRIIVLGAAKLPLQIFNLLWDVK